MTLSHKTISPPDIEISSDHDIFHQKCCICFEDVLLPVRLKCFSCCEQHMFLYTTTTQTVNMKSCYTYLRVCMYCADMYFQFLKPPSERVFHIKCLICPETTNPRRLTREKAYEMDFLYMKCLGRRQTECPYCHVDLGVVSHDEVYEHITQQCEEFMILCFCHLPYRRANARDHIMTCSSYKQCDLCVTTPLTVFVPKEGFEQHMISCHKRILCRSCHEYVDIEGMTHHILNECRERLMCCDICMNLVRWCMFEKHILRHYHDSRTKLTSLRIQRQLECENLSNVTSIMRFYNIQHEQREDRQQRRDHTAEEQESSSVDDSSESSESLVSLSRSPSFTHTTVSSSSTSNTTDVTIFHVSWNDDPQQGLSQNVRSSIYQGEREHNLDG